MLHKDSLSGKNYFIIIVAAVAGFGGFLFGFDSSVIADTKNQLVSQFSLTDFQWSMVVSASLLSSIFGIPLSGLFADKLSRKSMLQIVASGFIIGTGLCAMAWNLPILIIGRFIIGVCIGIASYISPLFIAEIAPANKRGGLILMNGIAITLGQAFSFLIGYWLYDLSENSWRVMLMLGTLPAIGLFIGIIMIPHSPRWLLAKRGKEAAKAALRIMRNVQDDILSELNEMESMLNQETQYRSKLNYLIAPPYLYVLLAGISLGVFQQFSGINAIMYYGPVIFESAGFHPTKYAILATFIMGFLNFFFTLVTLYLVDRVGRRPLLLFGTLLAAISLFCVSGYYHFHLYHQKWLIILSLSAYIIGYCISIGSLFWVIISEIFPLKIRGLAMSIATLIQWIANLLVSLCFLSIFHYAGEAITFSLFGIVCLLANLVIYHFIPETTGVTLEKIEENLNRGKSLRELGQPYEPVLTVTYQEE